MFPEGESWKSANGYYALKRLKGFVTFCLGDLIMKCLSRKTKIGLLLALIVLAVWMFIFAGCTAFHFQATGGTGKTGTSAATAMAAGEAWPAQQDGNMFGSVKKKIVRPARD